MPRAPKWSGIAGIDIRKPVSDNLEFLANANVNFRSSALLAPAGSIVPVSDSYGKINLRLGLANERDGWEVALVGKNLNDERIASFSFPLPNTAGAAVLGTEAPRTIALQISLRR